MSAVFQEFHQWESAPALKLMSDSRDWYARQSQMTVFGIAPSMQDVRQNFSDSLAMAVGITSNGGGDRNGPARHVTASTFPQSPSAQPLPSGRALSNSEVM